MKSYPRSLWVPYILLLVILTYACNSSDSNTTPNVNHSDETTDNPPSKPDSSFDPMSSMHFEEGFSILNRNGKKAFINSKGDFPDVLQQSNIEEQLGVEISSMDHFHNGLAVVMIKQLNGSLRWGYINTSGKDPFGKSFNYAGEFENGNAIVKDENGWGIIDTKGAFIIQPEYQGVSPIIDNRVWLKDEEGWTYVSYPEMDTILEGKYQIYGETFEGTYWVDKQAENPEIVQRAYANKDGKILTEWYNNATNFSEGLSAFEKDGKWGFVNPKGEEIIAPQFGYTGAFSEGMAPFTTVQGSEFGDWGFLTPDGSIKIPMQFSFASPFKNGYAEVRDITGRRGFINPDGQLVVNYKYDMNFNFHEELAAVKKGEQWGFINEVGDLIIPFQYDKVSTFVDDAFDGGFSGGAAKVEVDGHEFFINKRGDCIMGCLE